MKPADFRTRENDQAGSQPPITAHIAVDPKRPSAPGRSHPAIAVLVAASMLLAVIWLGRVWLLDRDSSPGTSPLLAAPTVMTLTPRDQLNPTMAPAAIVTVIPAATVFRTVTPVNAQVTALPTAAPAVVIEGSFVMVIDNDINLRADPATDSDVIQVLTSGTILRVTGPSHASDGIVFWPVRVDDSEAEGWVSADWIVLVDAPVNTTAVASTTAARTSTAASGPSSRFGFGATVYVAGDDVVVRADASFLSAQVATPPSGMPLIVIGPSVAGQGVIWWPVGDPATGQSGYVVEAGLTIRGPATATATPTP